MIERVCGDCTKCCEGWFQGSANGKPFYTGRPCHYVALGEGCSIYEQRTDEPCEAYKCAWLIDENIPFWFKPNKANIICTWRETKEGVSYLDVQECGVQIEAVYLNWLLTTQAKAGFNMRYKVKGGYNYAGDAKFIQYFSEFASQLFE
jgi:hypothetical protein